MLSFLHIENIAVIKKLDIDFSKGFTALTGETGAGKSIIIDSICLLLGARGSRDLIRSGEDYAKVSAIFACLDSDSLNELKLLDIEPDEDGTISVMRTIYADGRSQAKINSQTVQVSLLKEASKYLINIQSQHESQILLDITNHIKYLDTYAESEHDIKNAKTEYAFSFEEYKALKNKLELLKAQGAEKERMRELLEYQVKDIEALSLRSGEDEALEARRKKLQNAEKLIKGSDFVYRALARNSGGLCASDLIEKSVSALTKLSEYVPEASELAEKLTEYKYEIADIGERARDFVPDDIDDASGELDKIEARLDAISKLKKKYGQSVDEILAFKDKAKCELDELENNEELVLKTEAKLKTAQQKLAQDAKILHEIRVKAAEKLEVGIGDELEYLDMKGARFKIKAELVSSVEKYTQSGADDVEFLIAANPGEELKPMSKTASGGELSRVMLALKSKLAGGGGAGTLIFDEIDTGVSGKTCEKIGLRLKSIAENSQVFCITHSAQVASLADTHMRISKTEVGGRNETCVEILGFEERVRETARITSGVSISDKQLEAAREMVLAGSKKTADV
ncbi:MAG: DNA repair protein RecN [Clostridia bacterium]|nr:DNA repair protein RecN [Clostridia bacterium]